MNSETKEWGRNQTDKRPLAAAAQGQAAAPKKSHTGDRKKQMMMKGMTKRPHLQRWSDMSTVPSMLTE